jgi:hypothetical protein
VEVNLKTKIILVLGILSVVLLITTVSFYTHLRKQEQKWRTEMVKRLDSEEKAQKSGQEQATLSVQLKKVQESLQENIKEFEAAKKALLQAQLVTQNLKVELNKLSKLKEALEEDLKRALNSGEKKIATPALK